MRNKKKESINNFEIYRNGVVMVRFGRRKGEKLLDKEENVRNVVQRKN